MSLDRLVASGLTRPDSASAETSAVSDAHLHNLVQRFRGQKVVVVGDYILDRYHFCDATGVASEGPMMALRAL